VALEALGPSLKIFTSAFESLAFAHIFRELNTTTNDLSISDLSFLENHMMLEEHVNGELNS
jgi:hypothetical protein